MKCPSGHLGRSAFLGRGCPCPRPPVWYCRTGCSAALHPGTRRRKRGRPERPRWSPPDRLSRSACRCGAGPSRSSAPSAPHRRCPPTPPRNRTGRGQELGTTARHFLRPPQVLQDVILDYGVLAFEPVLVPEPLKDAFRSVALLSGNLAIGLQYCVNLAWKGF